MDNIQVKDISYQVFGKYQYCTQAKDGMFYADSDFDLGFGVGKPKKGSLPSPQQSTAELTEKARAMHEAAAQRVIEDTLPDATPSPRQSFWRRLFRRA